VISLHGMNSTVIHESHKDGFHFHNLLSFCNNNLNSLRQVVKCLGTGGCAVIKKSANGVSGVNDRNKYTKRYIGGQCHMQMHGCLHASLCKH
jgi:hypothetical protein